VGGGDAANPREIALSAGAARALAALLAPGSPPSLEVERAVLGALVKLLRGPQDATLRADAAAMAPTLVELIVAAKDEAANSSPVSVLCLALRALSEVLLSEPEEDEEEEEEEEAEEEEAAGTAARSAHAASTLVARNSGLLLKLVELLGHGEATLPSAAVISHAIDPAAVIPNPYAIDPAAVIFSVLARRHSREVVAARAVPPLVRLLASSETNRQTRACHVLAVLLQGGQEEIDAVLDERCATTLTGGRRMGAAALLLHIAQSGARGARHMARWAVAGAVFRGTTTHLAHLVAGGAVAVLVQTVRDARGELGLLRLALGATARAMEIAGAAAAAASAGVLEDLENLARAGSGAPQDVRDQAETLAESVMMAL
jgi:hypothetical protein